MTTHARSRTSRRRLALAAVPAAVAALLPAAAADGAAVQLQVRGASAQLIVTGLPGEANELAISRPGDGTVAVHDAGAPLYPGERCSGGGGEARCAVPAGAVLRITFNASAGNRSVSLAGMSAYAGSEISLGGGSNTVIGGPGADIVAGGDGPDTIHGGGGDDWITPGRGADRASGGTGTDRVEYHAALEEPVTASLDDLPGDGAAGENDNLASDFEALVGGAGDDRLTGSPGDDEIDGRDGVNRLDGGPGDDTLRSMSEGGSYVGGPGRDTVMAGADAAVDVRDGEPDRVECAGLRRPPLADPVDRLLGCVPRIEVRGARERVDAAGRFRLRVRCHAVEQRCLARLRIVRRGAELAARTVRTRSGRTAVALRLNARGRRVIAGRSRLAVKVTAETFRTAPAPSESGGSAGPLTLERR